MALPATSKRRPLTILNPLHPLAEKNFGIFWSGAFLSSIGFWIQSVGQGWQVFQLTNSALLLGLVSFATLLPNAVLSLFGGVVVDRLNRRYILITTQIIYMFTALLLGIFTTLHIITVWQIIIMALIYGTCSSVGQPAWQTFIGDLVPRNELKQGIALNSMQFNLSRVIGPAIGGISVGLFGIAGSYYLNALSYVAVIIPLFFMHPAQKKKAIEQQSIWQELREGLSYMHQHTALQLVLLLQFLIAFLVYPFTVLLPIFADNIFHIGPTGLGALNAAAGIGALIGSILVVLLSQRIERGAYILITLCSVGGLASLVIALTHAINMVLLLLMVLGASTVMSSIVTNTTVQTMVPEAIRGRILSIWVMITFGLAPFGNLITGWIAQAIGAPLTLGIGGALCLSVTLLIACIQQVQHRVKLA